MPSVQELYGEIWAGERTLDLYQLLGKLCPTVHVWERRA